MNKMVVRFKLERETKGAVRYEEVDKSGNKKAIADGATVGTLYLRKSSVGDAIPKSLTVTINETE